MIKKKHQVGVRLNILLEAYIDARPYNNFITWCDYQRYLAILPSNITDYLQFTMTPAWDDPIDDKAIYT